MKLLKAEENVLGISDPESPEGLMDQLAQLLGIQLGTRLGVPDAKDAEMQRLLGGMDRQDLMSRAGGGGGSSGGKNIPSGPPTP